jgi:hypothetical protein
VTDIWTWVYAYRDRVKRSGDAPRIVMYQYFYQAMHQTIDPVQKLALFEEGRARAESLGEAWWVLLFDHWRILTLLLRLQSVDRAREIAISAAVEARKPMYDALPQRVCIYDDLISIYLATDPVGYRRIIEDALTFMQRESQPGTACSFCHQEDKVQALLAWNELAAAESHAQAFVAMAQNDDHARARAFRRLMLIAATKADWKAALHYAVECEQAAGKRMDSLPSRVQAIAWKAAALQSLGDSRAAKAEFRRAIREVEDGQLIPASEYFDALSTYNEASGARDRAVMVRTRQLATLAGTGRVADEVRCRLEVCRLLAELGRPFNMESAAARDAASRLVDPTPALATLARLIDNHV